MRRAISASNLICSALAPSRSPFAIFSSRDLRYSLKLSPIFFTDHAGRAELKSQCELIPVKTTPSPAPTTIEAPVAAARNGSSCIQDEAFDKDFHVESTVRVQLAPKLKRSAAVFAPEPTASFAPSKISPAFFAATPRISPAASVVFPAVSSAASRTGSLASHAFLAVLFAALRVSSAAFTACFPTSVFSASDLIFSAPFCAVSTTTRAPSSSLSFIPSCLSISPNFSLASRCHLSNLSL